MYLKIFYVFLIMNKELINNKELYINKEEKIENILSNDSELLISQKNLPKYINQVMLNNSPFQYGQGQGQTQGQGKELNFFKKSLYLSKKNPLAKLFLKKPKIFINKHKITANVISFKRLAQLHGLIKQFSPAALEWDNSIYSYNNNYYKSLTVADKNLMRLVKSYFLFRFRRKQKQRRIKKAFLSKIFLDKYRKSRAKVKYFKKKRLSINNILVSKGNIKHNSNSAIITLFIYNLEKFNQLSKSRHYWRRLRRHWWWVRMSLPKNMRTPSDKSLISWITHLKVRYRQRKIYRKMYIKKKKFIFLKELSSTLNVLNNKERYIINRRIFKHYKKGLLEHYFSRKLNNFKEIISNVINTKKIRKNNSLLLRRKYLKINWRLIRKYHEYVLLLMFNKMKFQSKFIENLRKFASKIYNKDVKFNIIELKNFYLNSNIYSQIVTLKLSNRNYGLSNLLGKSIYNISIPYMHKVKVDIDFSKLWKNTINHNIVLDLVTHYTNNDKWLDNLFLKYYSSVNPLSLFANKNKLSKESPKLLNDIYKFRNSIIKSTKNRTLAGVRVEVRGRLTRRFKASRSVYRLKWIGGLRNIDSSYKGLSVAMMRGHDLSNVEYSVFNYKRRIGAYGVKGWVSSM